VAPKGSEPAADGSDPEAAHVKVLYAITPADEDHTLDFWAVCRDFAVGDAKTDEFLESMNRTVVLQDVAALGLLHERLVEARAAGAEVGEVSFKIDTGGLTGRRVLAELVTAEDT
jgi:hypothetical protein